MMTELTRGQRLIGLALKAYSSSKDEEFSEEIQEKNTNVNHTRMMNHSVDGDSSIISKNNATISDKDESKYAVLSSKIMAYNEIEMSGNEKVENYLRNYAGNPSSSLEKKSRMYNPPETPISEETAIPLFRSTYLDAAIDDSVSPAKITKRMNRICNVPLETTNSEEVAVSPLVSFSSDAPTNAEVIPTVEVTENVDKEKDMSGDPKNGKYEKETFCTYCKTYQNSKHFSRHLLRQHEFSKEVAEMLTTTEPNSKERRKALALIRKAGNMEASSQGKMYLKRRKMERGKIEDNYVSCPYCCTFVKENYLHQHKKYCLVKPNTGSCE